MKKKIVTLLQFSIITVILSLLPINHIIANEVVETPTKSAKVTILSNSPPKDTPTPVFEVGYYGRLNVSYNWPIENGATCTAAIINFWSKSSLSENEQNSYGDIGHFYIRRCIHASGRSAFAINTSITLSLPITIYFEVDSDQSFTSAIQDPIFLFFDFYPYINQSIPITQNTELTSTFSYVSLTMVLSLIVIFSKKSKSK